MIKICHTAFYLNKISKIRNMLKGCRKLTHMFITLWFTEKVVSKHLNKINLSFCRYQTLTITLTLTLKVRNILQKPKIN